MIYDYKKTPYQNIWTKEENKVEDFIDPHILGISKLDNRDSKMAEISKLDEIKTMAGFIQVSDIFPGFKDDYFSY